MDTNKLLIIILLLLVSCKTDKTPAILKRKAPTPIAHFSFNGNANDLSGKVNNGQYVNTNSKNISSPFSSDNLALNGSNYIQIEDNDLLDINTNRLSISAWIKPVITQGSYIVTKENKLNVLGKLEQGGGPYSLDIFPGKVRALLHSNTNKSFDITGTSRIKYNEWQHIALTWDGKNVFLYYNGKVEASGSFDMQLQQTNGSIYIGAYKWVFPRAAFVGNIDNVRIYNTYLSPKDIKDIYTNFK